MPYASANDGPDARVSPERPASLPVGGARRRMGGGMTGTRGTFPLVVPGVAPHGVRTGTCGVS
jgi:hypothetical protein